MIAAKVPKRIVFFFPYYDVSGVPMLFSRLAVWLAKAGWLVRVVDYKNGAMARRLAGTPGVELTTFTDCRSCPVKADEVLVMQSIIPCTMRTELRPDAATRLLFWNLYPGNLIQTVVPHPWFRQLQLRSQLVHGTLTSLLMPFSSYYLRVFIEKAAKARSLVFMDGENFTITQQRTSACLPKPIYIPVASDVSAGDRWPIERTRGKEFSAGWLGRLADFKTHSLVHAAKSMRDIFRRKGQSLFFHIIGDGPDSWRIDKALVEDGGFRVVRSRVLTGKSLDDYLSQRLDLLFAMGTSALEGAKVGLPTVLMDISFREIPSAYRFRWLHETREHNLGEVVSRRHLQPGNTSLADMLADFERDPLAISRQASEYYIKNHSIDTVATRFLSAVETASLTWGDIGPEVMRKGVMRRAYDLYRSFGRRTGSSK